MWNKMMHCDCTDKWRDVAPLFLRLALGAIFLFHGYQKIFLMGMPAVSGFLGSLGIPLPDIMAYVLAYGELIGGAFMILGLLTHWVSKFNIIVALVAFFTVHVANGFFVSPVAYGFEFIMLIGAASVSMLITGAGKYSLDAVWLHKGHEHN